MSAFEIAILTKPPAIVDRKVRRLLALFANSLRCNGASAVKGRPSVWPAGIVTAARDPKRPYCFRRLLTAFDACSDTLPAACRNASWLCSAASYVLICLSSATILSLSKCTRSPA